jgi:hypothetical protein
MSNLTLRERIERRLVKLHYQLLALQLVGTVYGVLVGLFARAAGLWAMGRFVLGLKPQPAGIFQWMERNSSAVDVSAQLQSPLPRALIHIAVHFNVNRLAYTREVIRFLLKGPFADVEVIADANSKNAQRWLAGFDDRVKFRVHDALGHPHLLSWACREDFCSRIDDFDLFVYVEDDMLIPPSAFAAWLAHRNRVARDGSYPGFVRAEVDWHGRLVASDFEEKVADANIIDVDGVPYLSTYYSYQACWIYDRVLMEEFIASPLFDPPEPAVALTEDIRAIASMGLTQHALLPGRPARSLIPLTSTYGISPDCFVYHLPSNYGRRYGRRPNTLATIPVDELIDFSGSSPNHRKPNGRVIS